MNKKLKIIITFSIILIILSIVNVKEVLAFDIWGDAKDFIQDGELSTPMTAEGHLIPKILFGIELKKEFNRIIDFLWGFGLFVIFISTGILGIKYMFVMPEEKSRLKQATTPYIIGVVIIFGALSIWKFVIFILEEVIS